MSKAIEAFAEWLDWGPYYLNRDFDVGFIKAAQSLIEQQIDEAFEPYQAEIKKRNAKRLLWAAEGRERPKPPNVT